MLHDEDFSVSMGSPEGKIGRCRVNPKQYKPPGENIQG